MGVGPSGGDIQGIEGLIPFETDESLGFRKVRIFPFEMMNQLISMVFGDVVHVFISLSFQYTKYN